MHNFKLCIGKILFFKLVNYIVYFFNLRWVLLYLVLNVSFVLYIKCLKILMRSNQLIINAIRFTLFCRSQINTVNLIQAVTLFFRNHIHKWLFVLLKNNIFKLFFWFFSNFKWVIVVVIRNMIQKIFKFI